jgi:hypothetical protein
VERRWPWRRWSSAFFLAHELAEKNEKKGEEWWRQEGVGGARVAGLGLLVFKERIKLGQPSHLSGGQRGCHGCAAVQRRRRPGRERADLGGSGLRKEVSAGCRVRLDLFASSPFFSLCKLLLLFLLNIFRENKRGFGKICKKGSTHI